MVLGIKAVLVKCATVCVKSVVILKLLASLMKWYEWSEQKSIVLCLLLWPNGPKTGLTGFNWFSKMELTALIYIL